MGEGSPGASLKPVGTGVPQGGSPRCVAMETMPWFPPRGWQGATRLHPPHCWELQDPKGTLGLGGIVGAGICLEEPSRPQGCPLPHEPLPVCVLPAVSPATGVRSTRHTLRDSQEVEAANVPPQGDRETKCGLSRCPKGLGAPMPGSGAANDAEHRAEKDSQGYRVCGPMSRKCPSGMVHRHAELRGPPKAGGAGA